MFIFSNDYTNDRFSFDHKVLNMVHLPSTVCVITFFFSGFLVTNNFKIFIHYTFLYFY